MRNEGVEIQQKRPVGQQTPLTPITANAFMTYEPNTNFQLKQDIIQERAVIL